MCCDRAQNVLAKLLVSDGAPEERTRTQYRRDPFSVCAVGYPI